MCMKTGNWIFLLGGIGMEEQEIIYRHNAVHINSIDTFAGLKGGIGNSGRDVFFVRSLGVGEDTVQSVQKLDDTLGRLAAQGKLIYRRINGLPRLASVEEAEYYSGCYSNWVQSNRKRMKTRVTAGDERFSRALSRAAGEALEKYYLHKQNVTPSLEKNFIAKLMYWFDAVMKDILHGWEAQSCVKIVASDVIREQEYLFYYMVTFLGADVLLIQTERDVDEGLKSLNLSAGFVSGEMKKCRLPEYLPVSARQPEPAKCSPAAKTAEPGAGEKIKVKIPERPGRRSKNSDYGESAVRIPRESPVRASYAQSGRVRQEKSFEELAKLASSVVMIEIHGRNGEVTGTGSGIMVGRDGYILTNNHVASGGRFYSVRIEDDSKIYTTDEIIKYNTVLDLAILRIRRSLDPIPVYKGRESLVRGQKVVAIGSPLGLFNSVSDGIISGFRTIDSVDMIQFTAPISHGSSGGAVLNMFGEVIGISTAGIDSGQNINLAVGYDCINMFIKGFE